MQKNTQNNRNHKRIVYNRNTQYYKGIPLTLIVYSEKHFAKLRAKRFILGNPKYKQDVWIPNRFLEPDGTIKKDANIDFIFYKAKAQKKLEYAHLESPLW